MSNSQVSVDVVIDKLSRQVAGQALRIATLEALLEGAQRDLAERDGQDVAKAEHVSAENVEVV